MDELDTLFVLKVRGEGQGSVYQECPDANHVEQVTSLSEVIVVHFKVLRSLYDAKMKVWV